MDRQAVIDTTRRWISAVVIGLNLCPFARRVFEAERIRYVVSEAEDEQALLADLTSELAALASAPLEAVETTLLIHPRALNDFLDFNDFLGTAEQLVEDLGHSGVFQIASFHPAYQFAGTLPDDVENYTNRSPHPMLHLLREESVTAVAGDEEALLEIPKRNVETLRKLGRRRVLQMLATIRGGTDGTV